VLPEVSVREYLHSSCGATVAGSCRVGGRGEWIAVRAGLQGKRVTLDALFGESEIDLVKIRRCRAEAQRPSIEKLGLRRAVGFKGLHRVLSDQGTIAKARGI
jgi:hypothetical protein